MSMNQAVRQTGDAECCQLKKAGANVGHRLLKASKVTIPSASVSLRPGQYQHQI